MLLLTSRANPFNAVAFDGVYVSSLGRAVVCASFNTGDEIATSDDGGTTWVGRTGASGLSIAWNAGASRLGVIQGTNHIGTSPDGIAWTDRGLIDPYFFPTDIASDGTQFIVIGVAYSYYTSIPTPAQVYTSTDGVAWTGHGNPFVSGEPSAVAWSPSLSLFAVITDTGVVYTSPTGAVWTARGSSGIDSGFGLEWFSVAAKFVAVGIGFDPADPPISTSPDGITWTPVAGANPFEDTVRCAVEVGSSWFFGGSSADDSKKVYETTDGGATFTAAITTNDGNTGTTLALFAIGSTIVAASGSSIGAAIMSGSPTTIPIRAPRFFEGFPWRFIFADIPAVGAVGGRTTTWANGLQRNRQIVLTLDDSTTITLDVDPSDAQVNILDADGYAPIAQTKRVVYCFRREGGSPPWVIRAAGQLMIVEDEGDADVPLTHLTAYDPWKTLEGRPCVNFSGQLPDSYGFQSWGTFGLRGDQIIGNVLKASIQWGYGGFAFVDAGPLYGGTAYYGGTIEATDQVLLQVQQGESVADVWRNVCDAGFCDIVLTPIYDPINRPGYTHELNVYQLAGSDRPSAPFAWDEIARNVTGISRLHEATAGSFANVIQYFVGQGGPPAPLQINGASVNDFGYWWSMQFFPDQTIPSAEVVTALATQALYLARQGKRTVVLNPTPERSPIPLIDYTLGDRIPVYATKRLRVPITSSFVYYPPAAFRIQSIPISIDDDGIETIQGLLVSPDWRTSPFVPPVTELLGAGFLGAVGVAEKTIATVRRTTRSAGSRLKRPFS